MKYNIIIDILDNNPISKEIANKLYTLFKDNNYNTTLLNENMSLNEKINYINSLNNNTIVISNEYNNTKTSEIIYSLYYDDKLPNIINNNLNNLLNIAKYYQLRDPINTNLDYYEILRNTPSSESLIIKYQSIPNENINNIVNNIYKSITEYINKSNIYIVKSGDSLYRIASTFNISVDDIKKANNLTSNNLSIGQELFIPKPNDMEIENNIYIVKSGDSLYRIASTYNLTVDELKRLNNLTSNNLSIGQKLLIKSNQINDNNNYYIVKSGDSLYKIARENNLTVDELKRLNNLTSNNLSIGQRLLISSNNSKYYIVKSGDSLYKIARENNLTVDEIKKKNNLTSNILSINQKLLL